MVLVVVLNIDQIVKHIHNPQLDLLVFEIKRLNLFQLLLELFHHLVAVDYLDYIKGREPVIKSLNFSVGFFVHRKLFLFFYAVLCRT